MASPTYNNANWRRRRTFGGGHHRQWGIAFGRGAMLGGNTPQYLGSGQPELESGGSLFGDGTPVYLTAPTTTATTAPSTTTSSATAPQPATAAATQPATVAVVVHRP
ncbi:MAG: hypothetical protein E6J91_03675 [Deltaproteobacteria bacterium]|nr:MAG: hypothetical protein E6J91_03675 [Deltaproteobacteria bacterium]